MVLKWWWALYSFCPSPASRQRCRALWGNPNWGCSQVDFADASRPHLQRITGSKLSSKTILMTAPWNWRGNAHVKTGSQDTGHKIGTCALVKLHFDLWRAGVVPPLSDEDRRHTHSAMTAAGRPLGKKSFTHTNSKFTKGVRGSICVFTSKNNYFQIVIVLVILKKKTITEWKKIFFHFVSRMPQSQASTTVRNLFDESMFTRV